jgi:hypothetical protein
MARFAPRPGLLKRPRRHEVHEYALQQFPVLLLLRSRRQSVVHRGTEGTIHPIAPQAPAPRPPAPRQPPCSQSPQLQQQRPLLHRLPQGGDRGSPCLPRLLRRQQAAPRRPSSAVRVAAHSPQRPAAPPPPRGTARLSWSVALAPSSMPRRQPRRSLRPPPPLPRPPPPPAAPPPPGRGPGLVCT